MNNKRFWRWFANGLASSHWTDSRRALRFFCPPCVYHLSTWRNCTQHNLPGLPPPYLYTASDQTLEVGMVWEQGHTRWVIQPTCICKELLVSNERFLLLSYQRKFFLVVLWSRSPKQKLYKPPIHYKHWIYVTRVQSSIVNMQTANVHNNQMCKGKCLRPGFSWKFTAH